MKNLLPPDHVSKENCKGPMQAYGVPSCLGLFSLIRELVPFTLKFPALRWNVIFAFVSSSSSRKRVRFEEAQYHFWPVLLEMCETPEQALFVSVNTRKIIFFFSGEGFFGL